MTARKSTKKPEQYKNVIESLRLIELLPQMWEIVRLLAERDNSDDPLVQDAAALVAKVEGGAQ